MMKIQEIIQKINPFFEKKTEDGRSLENKKKQVYNTFAIWLLDIHINGATLNFIMAVYGKQPIHYFFVLANGLALWIVSEVVHKMWTAYIKGQKSIR